MATSLDPDVQRINSQARAAACLAEADAAYACQDLTGARDALLQALSFAPDAVPISVCLGDVQFQLGAFSEALECYRRADGLKADDAGILIRLANAAAHCDAAELLGQTLQRVLALNPDHPDALRLAINHHLEQGRFAEAARHCCAFLRTNPNDLLLLLQLGKCLREINDSGSARWCYERALELDPNCTLAQECLARLNGVGETAAQNPGAR